MHGKLTIAFFCVSAGAQTITHMSPVASPVTTYRPVQTSGGQSIVPQSGSAPAYGIAMQTGSVAVQVGSYGSLPCEFDAPLTSAALGATAVALNGFCHYDSAVQTDGDVPVTQSAIGRILTLRPDLGSAFAEVNFRYPAARGSRMASTNIVDFSSAVQAIAQQYPGPKGDKGDTGATGPIGLTGPAGAVGPVGAVGATGAQGPAGSNGAAGAVGAAGATGSVGPTGNTGPQGATGAVGATGAAGVVSATAPIVLTGTAVSCPTCLTNATTYALPDLSGTGTLPALTLAVAGCTAAVTVSVPGAIVGHRVDVMNTDGTLPTANTYYNGSVTAANVVSAVQCATIGLGMAAKAVTVWTR